jgi:hypothetical protein
VPAKHITKQYRSDLSQVCGHELSALLLSQLATATLQQRLPAMHFSGILCLALMRGALRRPTCITSSSTVTGAPTARMLRKSQAGPHSGEEALMPHS